MTGYLEVQIVSTVMFVLAAVSNTVTLILCQKARVAEKKSFILLIQITVFSNILNIFTGWIVLNRLVIPFFLESQFRCDQTQLYLVCVSYGVGAYLGPRAVHLIDCLAIFIDTYVPFLICLMMSFRALILFDRQFKTRTFLFATVFVILAACPQMVEMA